MPLGPHGFFVPGIGCTDPMGTRHAGKHGGVRDVTTFLEERITQGKAGSLASSIVSAVGGRNDCEGGQRGVWEVVGVEVAEEVRGHLAAQVLNVLSRARSVERCGIDQLEGPGPHPHDHIVTPQLIPLADNRAKPDMGERAPDVRIDLEH